METSASCRNSKSKASQSPENIAEKSLETTVHKYIDEQGNEIFIEDPIYYEDDESTLIYGHSYHSFSQEIYQEEIVEEEYVDPSLPSTSTTPPTSNKHRLIKDPISSQPSTVLLTNQCLEAQNATYLARAGKKRVLRDVGEEKRVALINESGSILNRNLPGMTNMFKVLSESAIKKTEEMIKSESVNNVAEEAERAPTPDNFMEVVNDDPTGSPPAMEKLGNSDEDEFQSNVFDQWPLFSNSAIDFKEACELLIGIQQIEVEKVCKTVPLQFKREGTFIIDMSECRDLNNDDNGGWEVPSGKTRFYKEMSSGNLIRADDGKGRLKSWTKDFTFKIILKRYENRITRSADEGRGQFQKKVYTGFKEADRLQFAIITYSWTGGRPWNFVPPIPCTRKLRKPNWEKKSYEKVNMTSMPQMVSAFYDGFNIYSHCVVSFDEAAAIMFGATVVDSNKLCSSVPLGYRQNGTFVIDLKRMGHCLLELRRDDNGIWHKPSGFSRFYKIVENGDAHRVDKAGKLPVGQDWDVKVSSKRYEHSQVNKKFVRKIYTAKGKNSESFPGSPQLAVIVYYWKGEPIQFEPAFKQNEVRTDAKEYARYQRIADEEDQFVETGGVEEEDEHIVIEKNLQPPPLKRVRLSNETPETLLTLKISLIRREMENQDRFSAILDRAEGLLGQMEQRFGVEHVYAPPQEWNQAVDGKIIREEVIEEF